MMSKICKTCGTEGHHVCAPILKSQNVRLTGIIESLMNELIEEKRHNAELRKKLEPSEADIMMSAIFGV